MNLAPLVDPVSAIDGALTSAESNTVHADAAEASGDEGLSRLFSRLAGSLYESAAEGYLHVSLERAAETYRLAQRAYRRGGSNGRAFRMGCRAEKCEREEAARLARDAAWLANLQVAS